MRVLSMEQQEFLIEFEKLKFYKFFLDELYNNKCIESEEYNIHTKEKYKTLVKYYNLGSFYALKTEATLSVFLILCLFFKKDFFELNLKQRLNNLSEKDKFLFLVKNTKNYAKKSNSMNKIPSWILEVENE